MGYRSDSDYGLDLAVVAVATYIVTDDTKATFLITLIHGLAHYVGYTMSKKASHKEDVAATF
jgi:hypothetical protein